MTEPLGSGSRRDREGLPLNKLEEAEGSGRDCGTQAAGNPLCQRERTIHQLQNTHVLNTDHVAATEVGVAAGEVVMG